MDRLRRQSADLKETVGEDDASYIELHAKYYAQKARFEQIKKILKNTNSAGAAAQAEVDKANFGGELAGWLQDEIRETITGYQNWNATGDAAADALAGKTGLMKLEDDAEFAMSTSFRKMEKKDSDKNKATYYDALATYEFISAELGSKSPSKIAAKARKTKAAAEAALDELADSLANAKTIKDVLGYIAKASANTSPLPALLAEARTDEGMAQVLEVVSQDPKMAKLLATELLKAKTEDAAAAAFAHVAEIAITAGTDDPEVIMRAKLDSLVSKYVMGGEMAMAKIKEQFNKAAAAAQNADDLQAALMNASNDANAKLSQID